MAMSLDCPTCHRLAHRSYWPLQAWWCPECGLWRLITPFSGTDNGWYTPNEGGRRRLGCYRCANEAGVISPDESGLCSHHASLIVDGWDRRFRRVEQLAEDFREQRDAALKGEEIANRLLEHYRVRANEADQRGCDWRDTADTLRDEMEQLERYGEAMASAIEQLLHTKNPIDWTPASAARRAYRERALVSPSRRRSPGASLESGSSEGRK